MQAVSPQAGAVLSTLTRGLDEPGDHREVRNSPSFMSVHIEHIGQCSLGPMFSIAPYYEQNGDLMKYPDMVFIRHPNGEFYPTGQPGSISMCGRIRGRRDPENQ